MKIVRFDIQNFRKLQCCSIAIRENTTVFVGANNSGKTSALLAIRKFLKTKKFVLNDFTLTNFKYLNQLVNSPDDLKSINSYLPTLDIWLEVQENEYHQVIDLIPTLDWNGGIVGVRLVYSPKENWLFVHICGNFRAIFAKNKKSH